jgi:arginase
MYKYSEREITYKFLKENTVGVIGVSVKEGQDLEGPELAPEYLRKHGLPEIIKNLGWGLNDRGDIKEDAFVELSQEKEAIIKQYKYTNLKNILDLGNVNHRLFSETKSFGEKGQFCLTLGGDHGLGSGSISGLKAAYPDLKIIWVDAHADCNTPETSPSGNYHGMPAAHLLGWMEEKTVPGFDWFKPCLTNKDLVFIGLRDLDAGEKKNLKKHNIKCFTMHDVLKHGIGSIIDQAIKYLFQDGKEHPIHISFDIDGVDPSVAYGTGTKARGGLLYREAHYIMREVSLTGCLVGLDMVEINPLLDKPKEVFHGDSTVISGSETVSLGLELIASALGDIILS